MKLRYQWTPVLLLLFLIPLRDQLALPPVGATWWQHLLYPLAHANFLHWFMNAFSWLWLWRIVNGHRLLASYVSAILIGYAYTCLDTVPWVSIPGLSSWIFPLSFGEGRGGALVGFSVILFWFVGFLLPVISRSSRLRLLVLVAISLFIPGIAAGVHIAAICLGVIYYYCKKTLPPPGEG